MAAVHDGYVLQKSVVHTPLAGRLLSQVRQPGWPKDGVACCAAVIEQWLKLEAGL